MSQLGEVLETARRARGLTQEQLAEAVGIRQAALSRYEHGLRQPDEDTLARLADALGVTPDFLREAGRIRGAVAVDAHMRRRKTAKPSDWRRLEASLNLHRLHARRLFDQIALRAEQRVPTFDPFDTDPATAARYLRMQWRMPAGPVRNLVGWIEAAGCVVIEEDFGTARVDGLSQWIDEIPVMLVNRSAPTDRRRLTLAHELAHLCLHSHDVGEDVETEANAFAAEFLMPLETIKPQLRKLTLGKLHDLKREWGVSMQALIERAWHAKLLTPTERSNLYKTLSARGWRVHEPLSDELAPEVATLPHEIANALAAQGLGLSEIAHVVGLSSPDVHHPFLPPRRLRAL